MQNQTSLPCFVSLPTHHAMSASSPHNIQSCPILGMATIDMSLKAPTPGNSRGRAKGPCHNCVEKGIECDGQRLKYFICIQNQVSCRGYKLELSWPSGIAAGGNLKGFQYPVRQPALPPSSTTPQSSTLEETGSRRKEISKWTIQICHWKTNKASKDNKASWTKPLQQSCKSGPITRALSSSVTSSTTIDISSTDAVSYRIMAI